MQLVKEFNPNKIIKKQYSLNYKIYICIMLPYYSIINLNILLLD